MARRKSTKMSRMRNIEPMPLTLTFATAQGSAGVPQVNYIDLSQCAALAGRKFLRQGLNYGVASIKCTSLLAGNIAVYKLPNTWVMANAWMKAFSAWTRMNNDALEETESLRPRFLDFKIYADAEHHAAGSIANLLPVSIASTIPAVAGSTFAGEWEYSKIFIPNATNAAPATTQDFDIIATGASFPGVSAATGHDALSAIEGYAASRLLPNVLDPNTPDDAEDTGGATPENWMSAIFNEGNVQMSEVIEELTSENNIAPYPFENGLDTNQFLPNTGLPNPNFNLPFVDTMYPGGANQMQGLEWHDFAQIYQTSATTNVGITTIKGGSFPCGLIKFTWTPTEGTPNLVLQINMIPGSHRGYLAEPMQEM
jgi:hypothetical protein